MIWSLPISHSSIISFQICYIPMLLVYSLLFKVLNSYQPWEPWVCSLFSMHCSSFFFFTWPVTSNFRFQFRWHYIWDASHYLKECITAFVDYSLASSRTLENPKLCWLFIICHSTLEFNLPPWETLPLIHLTSIYPLPSECSAWYTAGS